MFSELISFPPTHNPNKQHKTNTITNPHQGINTYKPHTKQYRVRNEITFDYEFVNLLDMFLVFVSILRLNFCVSLNLFVVRILTSVMHNTHIRLAKIYI
ncbi:MAG: hypothetical protein ACK416_03160 [Zestosphaera sp.]